MTTQIEYCHETWNPIVGCDHSGSPGCDHCYAARMAWRLAHIPATAELYKGLTTRRPKENWSQFPPQWTGETRINSKALDAPLHWRKPKRIFVGSMTDLFYQTDPDLLLRLWDVMATTSQHRYLILTKRPEEMRVFCTYLSDGPPLPNVALGVTVCNQEEAERSLPILLAEAAAIRWVSVEPMLGPVDLTAVKAHGANHCAHALHALDWVVAGGETGPGSRTVNPDWLRDLRNQCAKAGVPFFLKQVAAGFRRLDGREHNAMPEALRLRGEEEGT